MLPYAFGPGFIVIGGLFDGWAGNLHQLLRAFFRGAFLKGAHHVPHHLKKQPLNQRVQQARLKGKFQLKFYAAILFIDGVKAPTVA